MTQDNRETLQRVAGMLSGITASGDVSNAVSQEKSDEENTVIGCRASDDCRYSSK